MIYSVLVPKLYENFYLLFSSNRTICHQNSLLTVFLDLYLKCVASTLQCLRLLPSALEFHASFGLVNLFVVFFLRYECAALLRAKARVGGETVT